MATEMFLYEAYRFQKTSQTSDTQKNTPQVSKTLFYPIAERLYCIRSRMLVLALRRSLHVGKNFDKPAQIDLLAIQQKSRD